MLAQAPTTPASLDGFDPADLAGSLPRLAEFNRRSAKTHSGVYQDLAVHHRPTEVAALLAQGGRIVAVPVLNVSAFRARSPFVVPQDGKNLNRCFPGGAAGTLAERLAHAVFTQLIQGSDARTQVQERIAAPVAGVPLFMTSSPAVAAEGLLLGLGAP